ncbi:hypothetical protein [Azospirillum agricola]|uniref:hypothetical protein n=1 Tax=Azospirillum agricola TaxID=1720247 RepID=UPI000A0F12EF|nr:hypothetical protein [Azospirillum agricola]SMH30528.1 hypothetical protein SAMN02982994_0328 [Azospirillum lipoferum]
MAGFFTDTNECGNDVENPCAVTSPGTSWATTAPLAALLTTPLVDAAVSDRLGTADDPVVIDMEWVFPVDLAYGGLFSVNLWQEARCRMEAWLDTGRTVKVADTRYPNGRDRRVIPGLYDPKTLQPGYASWLRGGLRNKEFRLYSTNIHANVPLCRARVVRWSLWGGAYRPDGTDDTVYRIGLGWAGDGLSITRHAPGSGDGVKSNTELIEQPGGYVWTEAGLRKRTATIDLAAVESTVRDKLFDAAHRAGNEKPIVWLPRVDSPEQCFRYGGLFRRVGDHAHKLLPPRYASTTMDFLEWKE